MTRIQNLYIPSSLLMLAACDAVIVYLSVAVGLLVSYSDITTLLRSDVEVLAKEGVFAAVNLVAIFTMGLYQRRYLMDVRELIVRVTLAMVLAFLALTIIFYLVPYVRIWISAFIPAMLLSGGGIILSRALFRRLADVSAFKRRVLVLGAGQQARRIEAAQESVLPSRFICVGFVALDQTPIMVIPSRVVPAGDLAALCERARVDEIVLALDERRGVLPLEVLLSLRLKGMRIIDIPSFFEQEMGKLEIESMRPSWLILSDGGTKGRIEKAAKRSFDVAASLALLILTLPLTMPTMLAVFLEDFGPIFYRQHRVGLGGREFNVLKFRSMRVTAEQDGIARWATLNDPRITVVGSVIRKLRIDEIPQIYNVLRGEMSFVGPRPERPSIVRQLAQEIAFYDYRHVVKPGITGWAQINYSYGASIQDAAEKLKFDLYYIKNYSLLLDFVILLQTLRVVLWPQGAR